MRLLPVSNLNLERRSINELPPLVREFDVLVCAGDLWAGEPEKAIQAVVAIARGKPAIVVPGGHDFYGKSPQDNRTIIDFERQMRSEADRQNLLAQRTLVTVLSASNPVYELGRVRFIGLTLWTDWRQASRWSTYKGPAAMEIVAAVACTKALDWPAVASQHSAIKTENGPWTPFDAIAEHARNRAKLWSVLADYHSGPTIVVTYHSPLGGIIDELRNQNLPKWAPAFYGSDLLCTIPEGLRPDIWVFGNIRSAYHAKHGRTLVVANPVEVEQFDPTLVIDCANSATCR